jgi:hypothetical protein
MSKTKMFVKKSAVVLSCLFASSCLLLGVVYGVSKASLELADRLFPAYVVPGVNVVHAETIKEIPIRLWVLNEFYEAGLNVDTADRIISCESKFNVNAINVNKNSTVDVGIFQINSIHKDIALQDKIDYKKATAWAIKKIKKEGWGSWVCK